ncbi:MAG: hypothetical protein J6A43_03645 [Clostridia bacterium]|nr:hypothetical protein [Clostridia bacterium]
MLEYYIILFLIVTIIVYKIGYATGKIEEREKIEKEQNEGAKEDET